MGGKSAETVLPLRAVAHVKRAVGSPVLEVSVELPNAPKRIGFYFMKPPRLGDKDEGFRLFQRYLAKRRAIGLLRRGNVDRGREVSSWVQRIRAAKGKERPAVGTAGLLGDDRGEPAAGGRVELDQSGHQGEQRVVPAPPHAGPGMDPRSPLADDDGPRLDRLSGERLHPEPFGLGVAPVAG